MKTAAAAAAPSEMPHDSRASSPVIAYATGDSPIGSVLVASMGRGLAMLMLGDEPGPLVDEMRRRVPSGFAEERPDVLGAQLGRIARFIENPSRELDMELDLRGSDFQLAVWRELRLIPVGSTRSYTEIAGRLGMPRSVRAVARACATNSVAIVVPCHRVVRQGGALAGYRWGVHRKRALLEREAAAAPGATA